MEITRSLLREMFYYEPSTGWMIRRKSSGAARKGAIAGDIWYRYAHVRISMGGKKRQAHRLVYLYHFGELPSALDHADGNPSNNRIENLRPCTASENSCNAAKGADNTSGYKGVIPPIPYHITCCMYDVYHPFVAVW